MAVALRGAIRRTIRRIVAAGRATWHAVRIVAVQLRVAVLHELQYHAHLVLQLVQTALGVTAALLGLKVVFGYGTLLNGWSADELLVLVGLQLVVTGAIGAFVQPSLKLLMEQVRLGTLDFTLIKPRDTQLLASTQKIDPWKLVDCVAGVAVIVAGVVRTGTHVGPGTVATFLVVSACGAACIYNAWVALSTLTFWFTRTGEVLDIARSTFEGGRWPVTMYPGWLRHMLTFAIPVGIGVTLPAQVLVGRAHGGTIALAVAAAIGSSVAARALWRVALRQYAGASA